MISYLCHLFHSKEANSIECEVTGEKQYSRDLDRGGMEIPCRIYFKGSAKDILKVTKILKAIPGPSNDALPPPAKMIKLHDSTIGYKDKAVVDLDKMNSLCTGDAWVYLMHKNKQVFSLTSTEKKDLLQGGQLNDNHINYAQKMLQMQFPVVEGLESTLLQTNWQNYVYRKIVHGGLQIIHSRSNHWTLVSRLECDDSEINIFDSLYDSVDPTTLNIIEEQFLFTATPLVNVIAAQKQSNLTNCGLFAIANATALLFAKDVVNIVFREKEM